MSDKKEKANHWIRFCHNEFFKDYTGVKDHEKEFKEGYFLVDSIIKKYFEMKSFKWLKRVIRAVLIAVFIFMIFISDDRINNFEIYSLWEIWLRIAVMAIVVLVVIYVIEES